MGSGSGKRVASEVTPPQNTSERTGSLSLVIRSALFNASCTAGALLDSGTERKAKEEVLPSRTHIPGCKTDR